MRRSGRFLDRIVNGQQPRRLAVDANKRDGLALPAQMLRLLEQIGSNRDSVRFDIRLISHGDNPASDRSLNAAPGHRFKGIGRRERQSPLDGGGQESLR